MARGYGQKELISKQLDVERASKRKLPIKVGSIVEFLVNPEWNGTVRRISKDEWQTISIDNVEGKCKILHGDEFMKLVENEMVLIVKK